jgi:hypothetical protein
MSPNLPVTVRSLVLRTNTNRYQSGGIFHAWKSDLAIALVAHSPPLIGFILVRDYDGSQPYQYKGKDIAPINMITLYSDDEDEEMKSDDESDTAGNLDSTQQGKKRKRKNKNKGFDVVDRTL